MPLDLKALAAADQDLSSRGGSDILKTSDLKPGVTYHMRILPPTDSLGGLYYLEMLDLKAGDEWFKTLKALGQPCPVLAEYEKAKASTDQGIAALANKIEPREGYFIPIMLLTLTGKNVTDFEVRVLQAKRTIITQINKIMLDPLYDNGAADGILDREGGRNITLTKTGDGLKTRYSIMPWPTATSMAGPEYDAAYANVPDVVETYKSLLGNIDVHVQGILSYLYGGNFQRAQTTSAVPANTPDLSKVNDD